MLSAMKGKIEIILRCFSVGNWLFVLLYSSWSFSY